MPQPTSHIPNKPQATGHIPHSNPCLTIHIPHGPLEEDSTLTLPSPGHPGFSNCMHLNTPKIAQGAPKIDPKSNIDFTQILHIFYKKTVIPTKHVSIFHWFYKVLRKSSCCGCSAVVRASSELQPQQHSFRKC